jgi:hypothetical protein
MRRTISGRKDLDLDISPAHSYVCTMDRRLMRGNKLVTIRYLLNRYGKETMDKKHVRLTPKLNISRRRVGSSLKPPRKHLFPTLLKPFWRTSPGHDTSTKTGSSVARRPIQTCISPLKNSCSRLTAACPMHRERENRAQVLHRPLHISQWTTQ